MPHARPGTPPPLENLSGARPTPRGDRRGSSAARTENRSKMQGCRMNSHSVTVHSESTDPPDGDRPFCFLGKWDSLPTYRRGVGAHFATSGVVTSWGSPTSTRLPLALPPANRRNTSPSAFRIPAWLSLRTGYTASLPPSKYSRFRRSYRCGLRAPPLYVSQLTVVTAAAAIVDGARKRDT